MSSRAAEARSQGPACGGVACSSSAQATSSPAAGRMHRGAVGVGSHGSARTHRGAAGQPARPRAGLVPASCYDSSAWAANARKQRSRLHLTHRCPRPRSHRVPPPPTCPGARGSDRASPPPTARDGTARRPPSPRAGTPGRPCSRWTPARSRGRERIDGCRRASPGLRSLARCPRREERILPSRLGELHAHGADLPPSRVLNHLAASRAGEQLVAEADAQDRRAARADRQKILAQLQHPGRPLGHAERRAGDR